MIQTCKILIFSECFTFNEIKTKSFNVYRDGLAMKGFWVGLMGWRMLRVLFPPGFGSTLE